MKSFLYRADKEILYKSSSGGAFSGIVSAFYSIHPRGICYGASFDNNFNVVHSKAYSEEETIKFRTSKYCFSEYSGLLPQIRDELNGGNAVLFSGTPCQVDALNNYLKLQNTNCQFLYTVDVLCHGAPDIKWWQEYKKWLEDKNNSKLNFFSFRWKESRWHGYSLCAEFVNGRKKVNSHDLQIYMDLYFTHLIMRGSCYKCQYATTNRKSDITLGDFWGATEVFKDNISLKQEKKGLSLIMCSTEKGNKLIDSVKRNNYNAYMLTCNNEDYVKYQSSLNAPVNKPNNYVKFVEDSKKYGFQYIIQKYAGYNVKGRIRFWIKWIANQLGLIK